MAHTSSPLVSPLWLAERRADPLVRVLDCSWYMPAAGRNPAAEFSAGHIPGAQFFDIDAHSDRSSPWPHMLPPPEQFEAAMAAFGIGNDTTVMVYDTSPMFSAPRVWWMLRAMGHDKVVVLDGGLNAWKAVDYPIVDRATAPFPPAVFTASPKPALVRSFTAMLDIVRDGTVQIVDARGPARFYAREPEPRPGVRGGHIPGGKNVHYATLLSPDGTMKPAGELKALLQSHGVDLARPIVTSCGSGVTAAIVMLALVVAGAEDVALYDGSWSEWGARPEAPVATEYVATE
jgi:thiosulfate/3-mercaptopyruvate sulfurtransferase